MPNTASAKKRLRQDKSRNLRNRAMKSEIKTWTKKTLAAIAENDRETAASCMRTTQSKLDKAAKKGVMHSNTVARRKALLARRMKTLG
ncbi:MAG: 30S ribosomal protein S20 [Planctomycetota bacterium]|jgi:small subunit ribosomal protein S20